MKHLFKRVLTVLFILWGSGLFYFYNHVSKLSPTDAGSLDAIIVLTGGKYRIRTGIELLEKQQGKRLFISGVSPGVTKTDALKLDRTKPFPNRSLLPFIDLGYRAKNTQDNGWESAEWMRQKGFNTAFVVTSAYHMPRSLLELSHAMPQITLKPYPVSVNDKKNSASRLKQLKFLLSEYTKYLYVYCMYALKILFP